jgi:hypothetical protein
MRMPMEFEFEFEFGIVVQSRILASFVVRSMAKRRTSLEVKRRNLAEKLNHLVRETKASGSGLAVVVQTQINLGSVVGRYFVLHSLLEVKQYWIE